MLDLSVRFYGGCLDKVQAALPRAKVNVDPSVGASVLLSIEAGARGAAAALCADLSKPALERAETTVVIGATAPWAEPRCMTCDGHGSYLTDGLTRQTACPDCEHPNLVKRLPLGPLKPLRGVAERARDEHERCLECKRSCGRSCSCRCHRPLRLVLAVAPDDGVCDCKWKPGSGYSNQADGVCLTCAGTGKALSSADVARELLGAPNGADVRYSEGRPGTVAQFGQLHVVSFQSTADLDEHGLTAAFKIVTEGA